MVSGDFRGEGKLPQNNRFCLSKELHRKTQSGSVPGFDCIQASVRARSRVPTGSTIQRKGEVPVHKKIQQDFKKDLLLVVTMS